jgi:hypothetical protein
MTDSTCTAPECGKPRGKALYCPMHKSRLQRHGRLGPNARDRHSHRDGYIKIKRAEHPLADANGWAYEHRVILFEKIGPGEHPCHWCGKALSWERSYPRDLEALIVDHLDDQKDNNDPGNLVPACSVCNFRRSEPLVKRWGKRATA